MRLARRIRSNSDGTLPQHFYGVLVQLEEKGPHLVGELAQAEGVAAPVMSRHVSALVDRGLAKREANPEDKRQVKVVITPEGASLKHAVKHDRDQWLAQRLRTLNAKERATLKAATELLERLEQM